MATVLTREVLTHTYIVPDEIALRGEPAIREFIATSGVEYSSCTKSDWEIVDVTFEA